LVAVRDNAILLVRQYRLLINGLSYEIPGGRIDENETPEQAAVRECLEETGVVCSDLKPLIDYLPSLDIWKNHTYVFYTEEITNGEKDRSERHEWIPLEKCVSMIFGGQITDSLSIIALLAFRIMRSQ
jgi:ADP-ribose pyrophosphatase